MSERVNKAVEFHHMGYNCAQAVVCAYADMFGIDSETAFKMSEGFGAGMSNFQDTCGAISGMIMVQGLKNSHGDVTKGLTKADTYKKIRELYQVFNDMNGSIYCKDLRGEDGSPKLRSCDGCIEDCAKIVEKHILGE